MSQKNLIGKKKKKKVKDFFSVKPKKYVNCRLKWAYLYNELF